MADLLIPLFIATVFVFGVVTYPYRHLCGEGPPDQYVDPSDGLKGRWFWVTMCTLLWPVQLVGGLHGLWRVYKARKP